MRLRPRRCGFEPPALEHPALARSPSGPSAASPGPALGRRVCAFAVLIAVVGTGCSTPKTASGTLDEGKERVTQLVVDAARKLPAAEPFVRPTKVGTQPCRRTVLGFVTGRTGAHRAEVPLIVKIEPGTGRQLLDVLAGGWVAAGYDLDRSRIDETGFPQLRGVHRRATKSWPPR